MWIFIALFFGIVADVRGILTKSPNPEVNLTTPELIRYHGYPAEVHSITTPDGYIIEFHRIPRGINNSDSTPRTPVYLQHGILCSSADWVMNLPHQSAGFALADAGYDVWIGNVRGNPYGRKHRTINPDTDQSFWDFSWDEIAQYDIPTILDYILATTKYSKLYYVGHSMGTTVGFAMLSSQPKYNQKIARFIAMAPVTTFTTIGVNDLPPFQPVLSIGNTAVNLLANGELFSANDLTHQLFKSCDITPAICEAFLFLMCGFNEEQYNESRTDVYFAHYPASTSVRSLVHYAQEVASGRFNYYDFGVLGNLAEYQKLTPPGYDVTKVTTPTALLWCKNDHCAFPGDVESLSRKLPNLLEYYQVPNEQWTHNDFVLGIQTDIYVIPKLTSLMPRF